MSADSFSQQQAGIKQQWQQQLQQQYCFNTGTAREPTIAGGLPASREHIDRIAPVHFTQCGVFLLVLR
jgi:hypothetical protein